MVALDDGDWCFAWLIGGGARRGARVQLLQREVGDKYPSCTPLRAR